MLKWNRPLWKHQEDAIARFSESPYAALFHEMGVGKTTTAIGLLRTKYAKHSEILPTIIFSPLATLWNWKAEFALNASEKVFNEVSICHGKEFDTTKKILIANYECLDSFLKYDKLKKFSPKIVLCDEGHRIKNPKSKRFKSLLTISDKAQYRYLLTGTPVLNHYLDLWAQMRFLTAGKEQPWGNYFVFRSQYFVDKNAGMPKALYFPNWQPHPKTALELTNIVAEKVSRVEKSQCLDLPPLVRKIEHVELSPEHRAIYKKLEDELLIEVRNEACVASNALVKCLRLLQIVSGFIPFETHNLTINKNHKLERLEELVEMLIPHHKIIIWATFKENYKAIISNVINDRKYSTLTGETTDRQESIDRFQNDPDTRIMLANPQAGGVGVNLTASSYAIYYSRSYSLGDFLQSEARNYRGGSEIHDSVTQIHLVTKNTIDEMVYDALSKKENISQNILDRLKALC